MLPLLQRRPLLESPLERLEREANDDFNLLEELGPEPFGTEHLLEIREAAQRRLSFFDRSQRLSLWLGAMAAGWLGGCFFALKMGWFWASLAAFGLGAASVAGFFGLLFFLKNKFESRGELEHSLREIEAELRRRAAARQRKF